MNKRRLGRLTWSAATVAIAITAGVLVPVVAQVPPTLPPGVIGIEGAPRILVFSATYGFRHAAITEGNATIQMMGASMGEYNADISENPLDITAANLAKYDAVVFHSTAGKTPLTTQQRSDFIRFMACGGGFVGIAMAADSNYAWPEYTELLGGNVVTHPLTENHNPPTRTVVTNPDHPINARSFEGTTDFTTREELYLMRLDPRRLPTTKPLLSLDISTISDTIQKGPDAFPQDAPVAWTSIFRGKGRSYYNGFGHGDLSWNQKWFRSMIHEGIKWSVGPTGHPVDRTCAAGTQPLPPPASPPAADPEQIGKACPMPTSGTYLASTKRLTEQGVTELMTIGLPGTIFAPNNRYVLDLSSTGKASANIELELAWPGTQDYDLGLTLPWGFAGSSNTPALGQLGPEQVTLTNVPHCADFLVAAENFWSGGQVQQLRPTLTVDVMPNS